MKLRALVIGLALAAVVPAGCGEGGPSERALQVRMRYSKFLPPSLTVRAGTTVDFTLVNSDSIEHEFILGTPAEQRLHERGDPHDPHTGPGQKLLAGKTTEHLRFTFAKPGTMQYACHRPGHYRFGMVGTITVET
jgi:uncharacterized cupredoxin-like copper-binding protein